MIFPLSWDKCEYSVSISYNTIIKINRNFKGVQRGLTLYYVQDTLYKKDKIKKYASLDTGDNSNVVVKYFQKDGMPSNY